MLIYGNGVGFAADLSPSGNTVKAPENRPPLKSILSVKGEHLLLSAIGVAENSDVKNVPTMFSFR